MARAPKLVMDDGSRVFLDEPANTASSQTLVEDLSRYFEIERIAPLIQSHSFVAVQFPDNLISYMARVLELLQDKHPTGLVFGMNGGCCPDLVTAAHLNATIIVQYGHACLSQGNTTIEIVHGFGQQSFNQDTCFDAITGANVQRLLVFYSLEYAHAVEALQSMLRGQAGVKVLVGKIPERKVSASAQAVTGRCCDSSNAGQPSCCTSGDLKSDSCAASSETIGSHPSMDIQDCKDGETLMIESETVTIGGLSFVRKDLDLVQDDDYSVLYIGSETNFQFMTIAMRLASQPPSNWFTINDATGEVQPCISKKASQLIKTRFYLIQKAKLCHVFGILVADVNRDEAAIQGTIRSLQKLLHDEGHVSYTFVVGSLNPAKLANFGEIDCFIWLACPEHSILQHSSTDYHVPVVTPYELLVAFDKVPWGTYETQVSLDESTIVKENETGEGDDESEDDAPFFSLVTGTFQQQLKLDQGDGSRKLEDGPSSLLGLPGNGIVSTYTSLAAERLKNREYKGLVVDKDAPVAPAVQGSTGIASSYNASGSSSKERR